MKKTYFHLLITLLFLIILFGIPLGYILNKYGNQISYNGNLKVVGTKIKNQFGQDVQLKGISSHGIQWRMHELITYDNLKALKEEWKINVFRIAMYTEQQGYIFNKTDMKNKVSNIVDMCIDLDLYVIIDWHILFDNNPQIYKNEAIEFFYEFSNKYKNVPNIIYEICNEPNGDDVTWEKDIVPYAIDVIQTIRNNSPESLIIVGTPDFSKDIVSVIYNPLPYENILYAFHFYAGSHDITYREKIDLALDKGIPIFVSEWGVSIADGSEGVFIKETIEWIKYLNDKKISWVNWAFSNTFEPISILQIGTEKLHDNNLTKAGRLIKKLILGKSLEEYEKIN